MSKRDKILCSPEVRGTVSLIAALVFAVTAFLEFTQLWHPAFLIPVRENFLGRTLIGNSFTWSDFPYYLAGVSLGALWVAWARKSSQ